MKALTINDLETPPALRDDLAQPTPAPNEVLVRVKGSSANSVDNAIAAGMLKQMGVEYEFPVILGRDYAGVVEEVGAKSAATPSATRCSASSCTPIPLRMTEAGPS